MNEQSKGCSKISTDMIREEAENLFKDLQASEEDGWREISQKFIKKYTSAPRSKILKEMGTLLSKSHTPFPVSVMVDFLWDQKEGAKGVSPLAQYATSALWVALQHPLDKDLEGAGKLLFLWIDALSPGKKKKEPFFAEAVLKRIGSGQIPRIGEILVQALFMAKKKGKLHLLFLRRWYHILLPLLSFGDKKNRFTSQNASKILDLLGQIKPTDIPDELLFCCYRLIELADNSAQRDFGDSPAGKWMGSSTSLKNPLRGKKIDGDLQDHPNLFLMNVFGERLEKSQRDLIESLGSFFKAQKREQRQLQKEIQNLKSATTQQSVQEGRLQREITQLRREREEEREDREAKEKELLKELSEVKQKLQETEKREEEWRKEANIKDFERRSSLKEQEDQFLYNLRQNLDEPLQQVRDQIFKLLDSSSDKRAKMVGAAFDVLNRKLLKMMQIQRKEDSKKLRRFLKRGEKDGE